VGNRIIFVCGGSTTDRADGAIQQFEKMDSLIGRWTPLMPAKIQAFRLSLCNINNEYIIKYEGKN